MAKKFNPLIGREDYNPQRVAARLRYWGGQYLALKGRENREYALALLESAEHVEQGIETARDGAEYVIVAARSFPEE